MKTFFNAITMVLLVLTTGIQTTSAHEGHDHDSPVTVSAPKGGTIRKLENHYLEVVNKGQELTIYLYDEKLVPVSSIKGFKVFAKAQLPRKKDLTSITLTANENSFTGTFDAKGAHRYKLQIQVGEPDEKHQNTLKFNIEPKK